MRGAVGLDMSSAATLPKTTSPATDPLLRGVNPDLKADLLLGGVNPELRRVPLLLGINPDLPGSNWKKFQTGTEVAPQESYRPGPAYGDVKNGSASMGRGDSGSGVTEVQAALRRSGQKISVDGLYGPKTEAAVQEFQRAHDLPDTGVVDKDTLAALEKAAPAPRPSPAPRPNNGGGGGGGGGGKVSPPKPPNVPDLPKDPYLAMAKVYDLGTEKLKGYHKGQNPAFDAAIMQMKEQTLPVITGENASYAKLVQSHNEFQEAATKAGF